MSECSCDYGILPRLSDRPVIAINDFNSRGRVNIDSEAIAFTYIDVGAGGTDPDESNAILIFYP